MNCNHPDFEAHVGIHRFEDEKDLVMADVIVKCRACGLPFHFVGVEFGVSFYKPTVSIDATELRIPMAPGPMTIPLSGQFKVEM